MAEPILRESIPPAPNSLRLKWYGPGLLWMLSAVGTGSILFTPRVAAAYRYTLLWLLLLVVFFMWIMIREAARFSTLTGRTMLYGMHTLPGPRGWAVWIILIPQLAAAAVGIAGLAAVVGSALAAFLPGGLRLYAVALLSASCVLTVSGHYHLLEKVSRIMALALVGAAVTAAALTAPAPTVLMQGLTFDWPADADLYVILPWVGTILAGSMGIIWFGYWTAARGFGGGLVQDDEGTERGEMQPEETVRENSRGWIRTMTGAATVGVVGGLLVITSFMILGAELLAPRGLMPEGPDVAVDLAHLFGQLWGPAGRILLLASIVVAIGGSILANQDGWGRSFADMTLILRKARGRLGHRRLKQLYIAGITGIIPAAIVLIFGNPVDIMSISGMIAAVHTPFIAFIMLLVNRTRLPAHQRPGWFCSAMLLLAGLFYSAFALLYIRQLMA